MAEQINDSNPGTPETDEIQEAAILHLLEQGRPKLDPSREHDPCHYWIARAVRMGPAVLHAEVCDFLHAVPQYREVTP